MGFLPPALAVLGDGKVTGAEISWYLREIMLVAMAAVLIANATKITEKAIEEK